MSVTRGTTTREVGRRSVEAIQRRLDWDNTHLMPGDNVTFDVTLPDVANVTVTTETAYRAPLLAGPRFSVWLARKIGVRAYATRITGDREAWAREAADAIRRLREQGDDL